MSGFKPFVAGALAGAAVLYGSLQYHVVRSNDGFFVVPRAPQASLGLAYADLRNMSAEELARRPELARAMAADSARQLLADNGKQDSSALDSATDAARDRLNATLDDWDTGTVPQPRNSTIDAPIWNPFADKTEDTTPTAPSFPGSDDAAGMFGDDDLPDAEPWPGSSTTATDVIPSTFGSDEIEFDPVDGDDDTAFIDIAKELDRTRELVDSRARSVRDKSQSNTRSPREFGTDVDLTAATGASSGRTHTTNHIVVPKRDTGVLLRDENDRLQNAVTRRARQIYERTRRSSSDISENIMRRGTSKANSAIDELISPFDSLPSDFAREIDNRIKSPQRYTRRAK